MKSLTEQFKAVRRTSVPIVCVKTTDPAATVQNLKAVGNGETPVILWDVVNGYRALNDLGTKAIIQAVGEADPQSATGNPVEALVAAQKLPPRSILFFSNAHRYLTGNAQGVEAAVQAVWNLRDSFKSDFRTLVLLVPDIQLPVELAQDVFVLDEPLPDDAALKQIVNGLYKDTELPTPKDPDLSKAVDALSGLSAFPAETATALNLTRKGLDFAGLWDRKYQMIDATRGLSVERGSETFADIGGLNQIKSFSRGLAQGERGFRVIVRVEEIEKTMAGARGDNTGVSQDALQVLLTEMEDNDYAGLIAVGPPGSGKSLYSKALGNSFQIPALKLDLGATKASLVGESEALIRNAMKVVYAIAGKGGAFFVATSNKLDVVPPELRRRFRYGIWYWDLPTREEKDAIWPINLKRYGLTVGPRPDDTDWTGSDIRNVCEIAWRLKCSLVEATQYIVPVAKSDPAGIDALRNAANGKYLSASFPGPYMKTRIEEQRGGRKINLE